MAAQGLSPGAETRPPLADDGAMCHTRLILGRWE